MSTTSTPQSSSKIRPPPFQPTSKMSSRPGPKSQLSKLQPNPALARSPPLTTSVNANTPHYPSSYNYDNPSSFLSPKDGGGSIKLKIKSSTTPEARSRLGIKPITTRIAAVASRSLHRAITPSDSEGSLADAWLGSNPAHLVQEVGLDFEDEEEQGETEAVLVTVRYVRRPQLSHVTLMPLLEFGLRMLWSYREMQAVFGMFLRTTITSSSSLEAGIAVAMIENGCSVRPSY